MSWNRRSKSPPSIECDSAAELVQSYLLGDLEKLEARLLESHLESCPSCSLLLEGDGETVARLAFSVTQRTAPSCVKERLLGRIETEGRAERTLPRVLEHWSAYAYVEDVLRSLSAHSGKLALTAAIAAVVLVGAWSNDRLNDDASSEQPTLALEADSAGADGRESRHESLLMSSSPGASVNMLSGTGPGESARGVLVASRTSNRALLLVVDLPALPYGMVYQVWLIKNNRMHNAGWFTVDSTGYGQTVIIPVAPFWEFDATGITIEPRGGSTDPTGVSVLSGEL